jgi:hypothetical protein
MSLSKYALFLFLIFNFSLFIFHSNAQGITKFGENKTTSTTFVDKNGKIISSPELDKYGRATNLICGSTLTINHDMSDGVAPETKTVTYGIVTTSISGAYKCWITQNLGADQQATSATDATDAAAGWYWQFNRIQGYANNGNVTTPSWNSTPINDDSDWQPINDPCTIELGTGWRIPTYTEWLNADGSPQNWNNYNDTYNSVLKLHAAGYLKSSDGTLLNRGTFGYYWSNTQYNATDGWLLLFRNSLSYMTHGTNSKRFGSSLRCIADFVCGNTLHINHIGGTVAPETKSVNYGTVITDLSGASKCWITQNLGADHQATSADDATDASAGWYWQFNRKQGYKVGPIPDWPIDAIDETSDWLAANDPCTIELGAGWRIPTYTEWNNAYATGGWNNYNDAYNSVLKLHLGGYLENSDGSLSNRALDGFCWSSTQYSTTTSWYLTFGIYGIEFSNCDKAYAFSLRCLKD